VRNQTPFVLAGLAAVAGYGAVWLPWSWAYLRGTTMAVNPIDGLQPISLLFLATIGFAAGLVDPRRFWVGGIFSMVLFPILAIWEAVQNPSSHNLLPIELMVYGVLTVPGIVGGFLAKVVTQFLVRVVGRS